MYYRVGRMKFIFVLLFDRNKTKKKRTSRTQFIMYTEIAKDIYYLSLYLWEPGSVAKFDAD